MIWLKGKVGNRLRDLERFQDHFQVPPIPSNIAIQHGAGVLSRKWKGKIFSVPWEICTGPKFILLRAKRRTQIKKNFHGTALPWLVLGVRRMEDYLQLVVDPKIVAHFADKIARSRARHTEKILHSIVQEVLLNRSHTFAIRTRPCCRCHGG